ncbi:MAG: PAS domain-containing sensor histidine kinase [Candidatus Melainabacteria bacterium]|jgi:signal transduction histidine kinase|nr:PAS domain-containing sensor histidine kinase [Candidatus Melainabacteria bacterium]OPZ89085.1 MAG: Alginate biosynthesis sensor protein KinB [bacterium ADurb.Bin425]
MEVIASVDGNGKVLSISQNSFEAWKLSADELVGRSIFDILYPEDMMSAQQALLSATFMKQPTQFECRVVRRDSIVVPMYWTAQWSDMDNAMLMVAQDHIKPKGGEDPYKEARETMRFLMESIPMGLFLASVDGKIDFANKFLENLMETGALGLSERLIRTVFPMDVRVGASGDSAFAAYIDKKTQMRVLTAKEREIPIEFSLKRVNIGGLPMYLGTVINTTERFELQRMRQKFIDSVQVQLKAPLAAIMMHIELTLEGVHGNLNEQGKRRAETILKDIHEMLAAIESILEVNKLQSGTFALDVAPNNIMALLQQALMAMLYEIREKELVLEINGPELAVMVDEEKLMTVVMTLFANAVRFSPQGSKVRVQVIDVGNKARVEIIDRGPGMTEDQKDALFDPLRQPTVTGEGGAGTILAARQIVEKHGGNMGVISHQGAGSNFWFELPKAPD